MTPRELETEAGALAAEVVRLTEERDAAKAMASRFLEELTLSREATRKWREGAEMVEAMLRKQGGGGADEPRFLALLERIAKALERLSPPEDTIRRDERQRVAAFVSLHGYGDIASLIRNMEGP